MMPARVATAFAPAHRLAGSSRQRTAHVVALAVSLGVVALLPACSREPQTAATSTEPQRPAPVAAGAPLTPAASLENAFRAIEDGERESPRDRWDPDYVVAQVGTDPKKLFAWVRDNTYWIPYRGVLRGPVGVLMDRQGNTLDRALLLAALLQKAGHTVRLAHGELAQKQSAELLPDLVAARSAMGVGPGSEPRRDAHLSPGDAMGMVARQYRLDEAAIRRRLESEMAEGRRLQSDLDTRVIDQTARLLSAIGQRPSRSDWDQRMTASLTALRDHWWVQRQDGARWMDLDVLAPADAHNALVASRETVAPDAIASNLRHEVVVRIVAEQSSERGRTESKVLEHTLRPADLIGTPVILRFVPAGVKSVMAAAPGGGAAFRTAALDQREWIPILHVGKQAIVQLILRDGPAPSGGGQPGLAGGAAGLAGGIAGILDGLDADPKPKPAAPKPTATGTTVLTAVWLEFEVRVLGEAARTIRRQVFDLAGPEARAASTVQKIDLGDGQRLTRSLALMMDTEILPVVSGFPSEFMTHQWAQSFIANREVIRDLVSRRLSAASTTPDAIGPRLAPVPGILHALAHARFEWNGVGNRVYLDRPNILTRHVFLSPQQNAIVLRDAIDIVTNEVGVDLREIDGFAARLEQGVFDTNAEVLLRATTHSALNVANAYAASPAGWVTLTPAAAGRVSSLRFPDDTRRRVAADLGAGYIVVAPGIPVNLGAQTFAGWWRIDRTTGHTLGIDSDGWGGGQIFEQLVEIKQQIDLAVVTYQVQIAWATTLATNIFAGWYYCDNSFAAKCLPDALVGGLLFTGLERGIGSGAFWRDLARDTRGGMRLPPGGGNRGGGKGGTLPMGTPRPDTSKTQVDPLKPLELGKTEPGHAEPPVTAADVQRTSKANFKANGEWIRYRALTHTNDPSWDPTVDAALKDAADRATQENLEAMVRNRDQPSRPAPAPNVSPSGANPCPDGACASPLAKSIGGMNSVQDVANKPVKP
jgi:hypothetical protein